MGASGERLVELSEFGVILYGQSLLRGYHMNGNSVILFGIQVAQPIVGSGHHLQIGAITRPRHVDIPSFIRILNEC